VKNVSAAFDKEAHNSFLYVKHMNSWAHAVIETICIVGILIVVRIQHNFAVTRWFWHSREVELVLLKLWFMTTRRSLRERAKLVFRESEPHGHVPPSGIEEDEK
jgi:hypothetical protein